MSSRGRETRTARWGVPLCIDEDHAVVILLTEVVEGNGQAVGDVDDDPSRLPRHEVPLPTKRNPDLAELPKDAMIRADDVTIAEVDPLKIDRCRVLGLLAGPFDEDSILGGGPVTRMTFRIATGDYAVLLILPPLLEVLGRSAPFVGITVVPIASDPIRRLEDGSSDVVIAPFLESSAEVEVDALFDDGFLCAMRKGHPAARTRLMLTRFARLRHLLISPEGEGVAYVDHVLALAGLSREVVARAPHSRLLKGFLRGRTSSRRFHRASSANHSGDNTGLQRRSLGKHDDANHAGVSLSDLVLPFGLFGCYADLLVLARR